MDTDKTDNPIKEVLDGLFTLLESMETQNAAVLELLKDQGFATDEKLAPYFDQAASASSVKWRAARARMAYLLAPAPKKATDQEAPDAKEPQGKAVEQKDTQPNGAEAESAEPEVMAQRESDPKGSERESNQTKELDTKAEPKNAAPRETKQKGASENSGEPGSNSTAASVKSTQGVSQNNSPDLKHVDDSKQVAKSKAAAARQSENDQSHNPATPASSTQSAK